MKSSWSRRAFLLFLTFGFLLLNLLDASFSRNTADICLGFNLSFGYFRLNQQAIFVFIHCNGLARAEAPITIGAFIPRISVRKAVLHPRRAPDAVFDGA